MSEWAIHVPERGSCCHTGTRSSTASVNSLRVDLRNPGRGRCLSHTLPVAWFLRFIPLIAQRRRGGETGSKDEKWKEGSVARMQRAALS